ncbi:platelet glycoprotein VI isoform X2 [Fukomys damarensis]|uniref:platelet glycoprotein VI isoform X2 n=1 Tax=Fukomys damarensis TaxID=885580 RepID=UPI001454E86D|nr:platelet glycoprotein VI isoform X2 [Fukomys damarensis]
MEAARLGEQIRELPAWACGQSLAAGGAGGRGGGRGGGQEPLAPSSVLHPAHSQPGSDHGAQDPRTCPHPRLPSSASGCVWVRRPECKVVSPPQPVPPLGQPPGGAVPALGLRPDPRLCLPPGHLPKPSLQALPSSLVPLEKSVTIECRGPPGVDLYRLEKLGSGSYRDEADLFIPAMRTSHAGCYRCSYQNGSRWSLPSDNLELVATGVYQKPSLSAHPGPAVSPGGDVTLQCQTQYGFDQFALYKEGSTRPHKLPEKWYRADFPIITVTAAHSGTYRCYSFSSTSPYLWSAPSDALELRVTGASAAPSQLPTEAPSSTAAASRDNTVSPRGSSPPLGFSHLHYIKGNLVRLCLGALVLVLLAGLLGEAWHSRKELLPLRVRALHRPLPPLPHASRSPGRQEGALRPGCHR